MQDLITKEIIVKANKERVYKAITEPEQIITWFPDKVDGNLDVGQRSTLFFGEEHHSQIFVESARPHEYFAFRWIPGGTNVTDDVLSVANTLVEFVIEEVENGTKITLRESGFASLPIEVAEESLKQNTGGWDHMIGRLEKALA